MSRTIEPINVTNDTFELWVNRTNDLLTALSTEIITANDATANTGTVDEQRRAQLLGRFGANTLVATDNLRGGNVGDLGSALLTISSNTFIGGNSTIGNATFVNCHANVWIDNANTQVNAQIITVTGNTFIKGNTSVVAINVLGNTTVTNTIVTGTDLFIRTTNTSINSISYITGNTFIKANSTLTLVTCIGNGTTANTTLAGNVVNITANLNISGNVIANLTVLANTLLIGSVTYANTVFTYNDYVTTSYANSNLGTNISTPVNIFTFSKTNYSSAKITVQVKGTTGNTQASEMVLAHNGTDSYITVYATVSSPPTIELGDFSTAISGSDVQLNFKQNYISSASKVIATLIK